MPYNKKLNVIFVHIPKCAGTTIGQSLDMTIKEQLSYYGPTGYYPILHKRYKQYFSEVEYAKLLKRPPQHFTINEIKKILGNVNSYFVFSVVRNPYDKLVSAFNKIKVQYAAKPELSSFENFVNSYLVIKNNSPILDDIYNGHILPQSFFLLNELNELSDINAIYKYENIQECFSKIQELNPNVPILYSNKGTDDQENYDSYYTAELKDKVYAYYKQDFDLFGYVK